MFKFKSSILALLVLLLHSYNGNSQQLQMTDFVLFGGNGTLTGCTNPSSPGAAVQIGSSASIQGGSIGSYTLIKTTGSALITGNIHSGKTIVLANSNQVNGKISAANSSNSSSTILSVGSSALLKDSINVKGSIVVSGGTVISRVTHPSGTTYTGPVPGGGNITGTPSLPTLPAMPAITVFPAFGSTNITTTQSINPGSYKDMLLSGNKTITLNGPGVYVFKSIKNSGSTNNFVFNFQNSASGEFKIYVHGDVDLGKVSCSMTNGGSASRIYSETHGTGSNSSYPTFSWVIANGSSSSNCSRWLGTVWAPYAAIKVGSGTGNTNITGALWSATQINIQCGVTIIYAPYVSCSTPNVNAGLDKILNCTTSSVQLNGSSTTLGAQFSWSAINGGSISTGSGTATPTATSAGTYILTVTSPSGGCTAKDTAYVTSNTVTPNVSIGSAPQLTCQTTTVSLSGSSSTPSAQFQWTASNGGIVNGTGNTGPLSVSDAGTYTLTVTDPANGCTATSSVQVSLNNTLPQVDAGTAADITCASPTVQLNATASSGQYSWTFHPDGFIDAGGNTLSPVVSAGGTYVLHVISASNGCSDSDSVVVKRIPCIFPYYPPPAGGKSANLIGSELGSLHDNFSGAPDTTQDIFRLQSDSVYVEVISLQGMYPTLLALLQTSGYGITDLIDNGPNTLIISGKFPVVNLRKLDSLPNLIDYARPLFPPSGKCRYCHDQRGHCTAF